MPSTSPSGSALLRASAWSSGHCLPKFLPLRCLRARQDPLQTQEKGLPAELYPQALKGSPMHGDSHQVIQGPPCTPMSTARPDPGLCAGKGLLLCHVPVSTGGLVTEGAHLGGVQPETGVVTGQLRRGGARGGLQVISRSAWCPVGALLQRGHSPLARWSPAGTPG